MFTIMNLISTCLVLETQPLQYNTWNKFISVWWGSSLLCYRALKFEPPISQDEEKVMYSVSLTHRFFVAKMTFKKNIMGNVMERLPLSHHLESLGNTFSMQCALNHHAFFLSFLGGHHLYMNLCVSVCLSVRPENCAFLRPPLVCFFVPHRLLGHWYTGRLGHQDTGT